MLGRVQNCLLATLPTMVSANTVVSKTSSVSTYKTPSFVDCRPGVTWLCWHGRCHLCSPADLTAMRLHPPASLTINRLHDPITGQSPMPPICSNAFPTTSVASTYRSAHRARHCCSLEPREELGFVTHRSKHLSLTV